MGVFVVAVAVTLRVETNDGGGGGVRNNFDLSVRSHLRLSGQSEIEKYPSGHSRPFFFLFSL